MARLGAQQVCFVEKPPIPGPWSTDMGMVFISRTLYLVSLLFIFLFCVFESVMYGSDPRCRQRLESVPRIPRYVRHPHPKRSSKPHAGFHRRSSYRRGSPAYYIDQQGYGRDGVADAHGRCVCEAGEGEL